MRQQRAGLALLLVSLAGCAGVGSTPRRAAPTAPYAAG